MGLFNMMLGNASRVDQERLAEEFAHILVEGETIELAYRLVRDMFVFTSKRLVLIDRQGVTGRKASYLSVPYAQIVSFAVETAGSFDADAELRLWIRGRAEPMSWEFKRGGEIHDVHRALAKYVLG